jgi:hypothetical protein
MGEKCRSTPQVTIHWRQEICHLGMQFVHKWLRKKPYVLCESCRGSGDLQLCYSLPGPLLFNFLEFWSVKQGYLNTFLAPSAPERAARRRAPGRVPPPQTPPWARHGRRGPTGTTPARVGALDGAPTVSLSHPARATRPRSPRRPASRAAAVRLPLSTTSPAHTLTLVADVRNGRDISPTHKGL